MNEKLRTLLVRILAASESAWLPIRSKWDSCAAIHMRRRREVSDGLGGGGGAERTRHSRERTALIDAGLLLPSGAVTPEGKRLARAWTWQYTPDDLARALDRFTAAIGRGDYMEYGGLRLVSETIIAGETWGRNVGCLQALFLPLLTDGVLGSRSTPYGTSFYFHADDAADLSSIEVIDPDAGLDEAMVDVYQREHKASRAAMLSDSNYYNELGELPVAVVGLKSGAPVDGIGDDGPLFTEGQADGD